MIAMSYYAGRLFAVAFLLNWIWEMAQMFAYVEGATHTLGVTFLFCTLASVGDAVLTVFSYKLAVRFCGAAGGWKIYGFMALAGALCAVVIEIVAINLGLWAYHATMPILPIIEVDVLPFLQLTLLMPAALWLGLKGKSF